MAEQVRTGGREGRPVTRLLPVLLLLVSAVAASAEPVVDGFETETLGSLWNTRFVSVGRVTIQRDVVHSR